MSERQTIAVIVLPTEDWAAVQRGLPKGCVAYAETPEGERLAHWLGRAVNTDGPTLYEAVRDVSAAEFVGADGHDPQQAARVVANSRGKRAANKRVKNPAA